MQKHHYRVTLDAVDAEGTVLADSAPLRFVARCHDDIFAIVERSRQRGQLSADDAAAMAVGLKLFGEIALENRKDPLFSQISQDLGAFIGKLKGTR
ncbi:MAG: hypothetical protein CGU28_02260 [Candidatus Dactylopiibacterium carminicum]|uniref:DUF3861 domain-containing protein n=1 Tax=Candidatus Dactylopiibacterium carminicum TaxID=857335 RepID=A0A272EVC0_9RHOO|nr:DUF3861 domain-containing protein [Candidatus Dactylopiibacterium carminicum]KAF7600109.1 DUF3861 domain-containing protein [Candidatus Dactylopiibacterium carminicum]PAS94061.1 MAG: hypothetical protein CGU29_05315 [Candidatus Dactylopiibacterium carminicum]PAS98176.1 MAG: hypothetical protein CGU28_02260 [Candidatus Dactylopiibacterium carminicum]PAT00109.1 MAG: hypothetical protein BSR46_04270 [Candidatus Dactylopiibacterium carminicum]